MDSATLGTFTVRLPALPSWAEPIETLIVTTKAAGLPAALERIHAQPRLVLPLLNGLDHLGPLRERFGGEAVIAGTIRVESRPPEAGVIVHTSPFLRVEMASAWDSALEPMKALARRLQRAGVEAHVFQPASAGAEAQVMWSKLVRLAPLACMTSAHDLVLGRIRADPRAARGARQRHRGELRGRRGRGRRDRSRPRRSRSSSRPTPRWGARMQRDLVRPAAAPGARAIAGAVLEPAARHGLACPTIERLTAGDRGARGGVPRRTIQCDDASRSGTKSTSSSSGRCCSASPALEAAAAASEAAGLPPIALSPAQGRLLRLLVEIHQARLILELGTLGGYSTICLAARPGPGGKVIGLEVNPGYAEVRGQEHRRSRPLADRAEVASGPRWTGLARIAAEGIGPFDLVFIDADKDTTPEYFEWSLRLARPGSVILTDNVVRDGALVHPRDDDPGARGMHRFHELLAGEPRVEATTIQTVGVKGYDGFTLARVKD